MNKQSTRAQHNDSIEKTLELETAAATLREQRLEGAEFAQFMQRVEKKSKPRLRYAIRKRDGSLVERKGWPLFLRSPRRANAMAKRLRGSKVERYADYARETRGRKRGTAFRSKGNEKSTKSLGQPVNGDPGLDDAINRARARYLLLPPERRPRGYAAWARFLNRSFGRVFSPHSQAESPVAISGKKRTQMRILTQEIQRRAREIERSQRHS